MSHLTELSASEQVTIDGGHAFTGCPCEGPSYPGDSLFPPIDWPSRLPTTEPVRIG